MSSPTDGTQPETAQPETAQPETAQPIGSAAEEAARLVAAAHQWWDGRTAPSADSAAAPASAVPAGDHPAGCRSCPWCRARTLLSGISPEVVEHLTAAATSLAAAVRELTRPDAQRDGQQPEPRRRPDDARSPEGPRDHPPDHRPEELPG